MKKFLVLTLALLNLNAFALDPRCQSENICTFAQFPLLRQNDPTLLNYIAKRTSQDPAKYRDPGLCAAVANTMVVNAIVREKLQTTKGASPLLSKWASLDPYTAVYDVGSEIKTNFVKGGTKNTDTFNGYKNFFKFINQRSFQLSSEGVAFWDNYFDKYDEYRNEVLIQNFKNKKHILQANVISATKKEKKILWEKITWYDADTGHAVAINGFDGNRLKLFDPWGAIYPVQTRIESVKMNPLWSNRVTMVQVVGPVSGMVPVGFVGREYSQGKIVILSGYIKADAY